MADFFSSPLFPSKLHHGLSRSVAEKRQTGEWNVYYNYERPHESLSNMTPMEYSKRSAVNDPDVADRLCEGGPCHPFGQGYTSVLRTALTERPPESLFGIAAQQRPKKQRKFTREVETQT